MAGRCDQCGVEEYMPYVCKFCKGRYCATHRLPENHACQGLDLYRERMRAEGRVFQPEVAAPIQARVAPTARAGASMDAFWSRVQGKMTWVFLGVIVAVYVLEFLVIAAAPALFDDLFVIEDDFLTQPWTIVLSMFAHSPVSFNHILVNSLVLIFFGQTTERLIGTRRFTYLFLGAGVVSGIGQVLLTQVFFPGSGTAALGASGAIQGIMGTLVILAPTLSVLVFFVIPAPLWAITVLYVLLDLLGAFNPGSGTAHFAHLAGLAAGIAFGYHLRKKGLRAVTQPPPSIRRYF